MWNAPQFAVPTSMQVFVPAVQYAGQQSPDFQPGSQASSHSFTLLMQQRVLGLAAKQTHLSVCETGWQHDVACNALQDLVTMPT